jgi:hypothetical protein
MSGNRTLVGKTERFAGLRERARRRRAQLFHRLLAPRPDARILDLGGGAGGHIAGVLPHHDPSRITVADIDEGSLRRARDLRGFRTVLLDEHADRLPFSDSAFDIVFCSSVIEHVTVPRRDVYSCRSGRAFRARAHANQRLFAGEVRRVAKAYFVQTPGKYFFVESHSLLPMPIILLPRPVQIVTLRCAGRLWIKGHAPNFLLLSRRQMRELFPDADLHAERWLGMTKSIMAVRSSSKDK